MIKPCQVSEIVPKDPSIKPATIYLVSYPNQSFAITRYIPNPSCNFSESDFSYKITEQEGSLVPDWLTLNTNGYLVYALSYLLVLPKFSCWETFPDGSETQIPDWSKQYNETCKPDYFCDASDVRYEYDFEDKYTLNNWMWKF